MKCPWCGQEVTTEEYSTHLDRCKGYSQELPLLKKEEKEMLPVGEWLRLGRIVPPSEVCDLLLQLSMVQARYALEDVRRFTTPQPAGLPPYTKELFERHIEDATTRLGVILEIASRISCPNIESIKHNARIVFEIRKKYLGLGYRLE